MQSRVLLSCGRKTLQCSRIGTRRATVPLVAPPTVRLPITHRRNLDLFRSTRIRIRNFSSSKSNQKIAGKEARTSSNIQTLIEHPIQPQAPTTTYTLEADESWSVSKTKVVTEDESNNSKMSTKSRTPQALFFENILTHFLPANYPASVAPGYDRFASLCFCASVAGSAGMVLSTQTLLLAVGIVGQNTQTASIMAGALNWVLKDGIGQLGGVWFASYMGRSGGSSQFDANPKCWRMTAAICLDAATLLEIAAPLVPPGTVLALASVANVGKNVGFLTASASRAALHQSLAISGNLGDVTAKTGSQSIAASLVGTALGIGLSPLLGDVPHFMMGFLVLSFLHQGCNYLSLQAVPLAHFNRHRLHLVLQEAVGNQNGVLSPAQVASQETFLPFLTPDDSHNWLVLGSTIQDLGGPAAVQDDLNASSSSRAYILTERNEKLHLVFKKDANASDLLEGMHHAYSMHHGTHESAALSKAEFQQFLAQLTDEGWNLDTEVLRIEPHKAVRVDCGNTILKKEETSEE